MQHAQGERKHAQTCPNCGQAIAESDRFCPSCGQKTGRVLPPFREIVTDFFDSTLNLNSKLLRSIRDLVIPGQLTIQYFRGKKAGYYPPLRIFFISMLGFYTLIGLLFLPKLDSINPYEKFSEQEQQRELVKTNLNNTREVIRSNPSHPLYEDLTAIDSFSNLVLSSVNPPADPPSPDNGDSRKNSRFLFQTTSDSIPMEDIMELEPDSLFSKYRVTSTINKLLIRQTRRAAEDPAAMTRFLIGNTTWMLIFLIPFVALGMKLLFNWRKRYYIEHVVFLFHFHAFVFLFLTLLVALQQVLSYPFSGLGSICLLAFLWVALKRYYRNSILKTTLRYFALLVFYTLTLLIFIVATGAISFLVFN